VDPWPAHARAIIDSVRLTLDAYQERFSAADRDSLQRFYAEDSNWKWAVNGRFGNLSSFMIRSRLDRLAAYPHWFIGYKDPAIQPLAPGLAVVQTEYRLSFEAVDGKRFVYDGALTMFWKHQPQGWKVVGGHSSSRSDSEP
jgi:ketosteroid isomerase-like protein